MQPLRLTFASGMRAQASKIKTAEEIQNDELERRIALMEKLARLEAEAAKRS